MVIVERSNIFSLETKIFSAAGQFVFPFYFSFDQALIQYSATLNQSAQFALVRIATIS